MQSKDLTRVVSYCSITGCMHSRYEPTSKVLADAEKLKEINERLKKQFGRKVKNLT